MLGLRYKVNEALKILSYVERNITLYMCSRIYSTRTRETRTRDSNLQRL